MKQSARILLFCGVLAFTAFPLVADQSGPGGNDPPPPPSGSVVTAPGGISSSSPVVAAILAYFGL